ncbi:MAG: DNA polymerase III subunit delta [Verrucomicrobia bacterium]|jgi:DNA polymerase-3 subunit delta|nr:DNA polymerase III subunit delta [Verrucomicrobiota bacterium]
MPASASPDHSPVRLICGEDEFTVKQKARERFAHWSVNTDGMDQEIIDAGANNADEAMRALGKLREALNTLPFFGGAKVVWFKDCNFLGDDRTATSQAITAALGDLAEFLKAFPWQGVRLLISAGKVDKRRTLYKTLGKIGEIEMFSGWSVNDRDWADQAEAWAAAAVRQGGKTMTQDAMSELLERAGGQPQQLASEVEKLLLYVGTRDTIQVQDVEAICLRSKQARAFALGDALGDRDLPTLLRRLDEELWEVKLDPRKSEIGLLYGIISKVRAMLLLKEMLRLRWVRPGANFQSFRAQLERIPGDRLPEDRRYSPLGVNPYVLFKALPQAARYTAAELVRAMDLLLQCNRRLVGSGLNPALVIQQTLTQIVGAETAIPKPRSAGR